MARVPAQQRRRDFVDATVRVIAEHGVAGATTRRIADEAGAALASLHYCFGSKEELFLAVYEEQARRLHDRALEEASDVADLASAAMAMLEFSVDWFRLNPTWARAQVDLLLWSLHHAEGDLAARSDELHVQLTEASLRRSCGPHDDLDTVAPTSRLIGAFADGLLLRWFSSGDDDILQKELKVACEALGAFVEGRRRPRAGQPSAARRGRVRPT